MRRGIFRVQFDRPLQSILRQPVVKKRTGYSRVQIYRKSKDPDDDFPAPVQLGPNAIGWFEDEIDAWLVSRPRCYGAEAHRLPNHAEHTETPDAPAAEGE